MCTKDKLNSIASDIVSIVHGEILEILCYLLCGQSSSCNIKS